jgi:hypothetical protein
MMGRANLPPDEIAYRRMLTGGAAAFVGGFVATGAALAWVVIRFGPPTGHWSAVVHLVILGLMLPFFGGCSAAVAAMSAVDRWYHWRGAYRCIYCDRPRRRQHEPCACWSEPGHPLADLYAKIRRQHHPPRFRHFRKRLGAVLTAYVALVPVVLFALRVAPRPRTQPLVVDLVEGHFVLCAAVAVSIAVLTSTLEMFRAGRRYRMRADAFVRVFALWPVLAAFAAAGIAFFRR